MIARQDDLIGTLPMQNNTGSPALAGQPPGITGANPAIPPTPNMSGAPGTGPALAPASPESGSADIGAPLSNAAPDQQAGAGANLDLVPDRGTPDKYWAGSFKKLGSGKALDLMGSAANAASGKSGHQAKMNPEEVRRAGVEANEAFGIGNTREQQNNAVESVIYTPMVAQVQGEVETGVLGNEEGVIRVAQTIAQVEGIKDEDDLRDIIGEARSRVAGQGGGKEEKGPPEDELDLVSGITVTPKEREVNLFPEAEVTNEMDALMAASAINTRTTQLNYERDRKKKQASKDYDGDGEKDNVWKRMKNWWKKGKDDPSTSVDESIETYRDADGNWQTRDVEVTSFMGGMTRQELGMFVFQWGAQMMANSDEGFGTAMGLAGDEAMKGHQLRTRADQANETSTAQQKIENQMNQQKADAATSAAATGALREGFRNEDTGYWMIPSYDPETNEIEYEPATGKDGKPIKADEMTGKDGYAGQWAWATGIADAMDIPGISKEDMIKAMSGAQTELEEQQNVKEMITDKLDQYLELLRKDPTGALIREAGFTKDETYSWETATGAAVTKKLADMNPGDLEDYAQYQWTVIKAKRAEWEKKNSGGALPTDGTSEVSAALAKYGSKT